MGKVGEDFPDHLANEPNQLLIRALQTASLEALQAIWQPEFNLYRATPNHLAIASLIASMAQRCSQQAEAMPGYVKILDWVLEQGARVDGHWRLHCIGPCCSTCSSAAIGKSTD